MHGIRNQGYVPKIRCRKNARRKVHLQRYCQTHRGIYRYNQPRKSLFDLRQQRLFSGFCVTRKGLLEPSKLGHILTGTTELKEYTAEQGAFIKYKGRSCAWVNISDDGQTTLTDEMTAFLKIEPGMKLLSIRRSDIASTMGAYGRLVEESMKHTRMKFLSSNGGQA